MQISLFLAIADQQHSKSNSQLYLAAENSTEISLDGLSIKLINRRGIWRRHRCRFSPNGIGEWRRRRNDFRDVILGANTFIKGRRQDGRRIPKRRRREFLFGSQKTGLDSATAHSVAFWEITQHLVDVQLLSVINSKLAWSN